MKNLKKRIFLIECSAEHWLGIAENLASAGMEVAYWTAWNRLEHAIGTRFPDTEFHDTLYAKLALDVSGQRPEGVLFDDVCHNIWLEEAQTVFDMMNRFDYSRDQTFVEKTGLFYQHLMFWRSALHLKKPDLVIFSTPPHVVYDYIIRCLCRRLGIRTMMFEEATIYPPFCLVMDDFIEGSAQLRAQSQITHQISEGTRSVVARLRSSYDLAKPEREVVAHKAMDAAIAAGSEGLRHALKTVVNLDHKFGGSYEINEKIVNVSSLVKEKGRPLRESFFGRYANSRYMVQRIREQKFTDELRSFYLAHCMRIEDVTEKFVYVALAGQPERTSNPQAGVFTNQILMVNWLACTLPDGWVVVVREHPNQFHPQFAVNMCRDIEYYRSLLALDRVRLVPNVGNPFEIIDRASVVASSGGTSLLEGVARGKPGLLFGDAWYRDCPYVARIMTVADLQQFWSEGLVDVDPARFDNYVEAIRHGCFRGLADAYPDGYPVSDAENIENISKIILTSF